ncbi:response regulator transcription factor [Ornithinibacillus gellani]|uniref:response regulator transcription factor n=1 Tax=Ornithinibacillus gellani TaxID=2293253 RepID=UPI000F47BAE4|nr:response regulator transcription factor [Ornithinibacillus gellani]TQS70997.1 response regulator transcription factor [Ornithinibacillus gellani]
MAKEDILLIEDEEGIRGLVQLYLEKKGYTVFVAEDGEQGLELLQRKQPKLVLLDIEMPGMDGFEVCKRIRQVLNIPIIFISCRRDVMDKVKCFELGGDDYITKPFDFAELEARITAHLRRYRQSETQSNHIEPMNLLKFKGLTIDLDSYSCYVHGKPCNLSTKELQLLILLAQRPKHVWSAEQLYDQIWGYHSTGDVQTVKVHISNLRRKLEKKQLNPQYIQTVRGFGYIFNPIEEKEEM